MLLDYNHNGWNFFGYYCVAVAELITTSNIIKQIVRLRLSVCVSISVTICDLDVPYAASSDSNTNEDEE